VLPKRPDDAAAEDVGHTLHVRPPSGGAHLDQHQLALDVLGLRQIDHLTTSISLFSCLVICSTTSSEPLVTMVMRDIEASWRRHGSGFDVVAAR